MGGNRVYSLSNINDKNASDQTHNINSICKSLSTIVESVFFR